jgi:hypothetical protein
MEPLPMAPATCSLDEAELRAQLARYRAVGAGADVLRRSTRQLVIRVGDPVSPLLVEKVVAIERRCCPFFEFGWEQSQRRLTISVSSSEQEPALDAIAYALGLSSERPRSQASA